MKSMLWTVTVAAHLMGLPFLCGSLFGQYVLPGDHSVISTTHVLFEWPEVPGADVYEVEISGLIDSTGQHSFDRRIKTGNISFLVESGFDFGKQYKWHVTAFLKHKVLAASPTYHFSILNSKVTDTSFFQQEVHHYGTPSPGLIIVDHIASVIDKHGNVVWFAKTKRDSLNFFNFRDVNLTRDGRITYLDAFGAYEMKLTGEQTWKAPRLITGYSKTEEQYHHQLSKLPDGTFLTSGFVFKPGDEKTPDVSPKYNSLLQIDTGNRLIWQWDELKSLTDDSLFTRHLTTPHPGHLNGFAFSNDHTRLFISFKNYSDVFALDKRTGKFESGIRNSLPVSMLRQQHGPTVNASGQLLIYNNNLAAQGEEPTKLFPTVEIFGYDSRYTRFKHVRSYKIGTDHFPAGIQGKEGYVTETKNGNMLVCVGGQNYSCEINTRGQKTWECFFRTRFSAGEEWQPYSNYRCHPITSLYPYHVTLQYLDHDQNHYRFILYNAGGSAQRWKIDSKNNTRTKQFTTGLIPSGGTRILTIPSKMINEDELTFSISSIEFASEPKIYRYTKRSFGKF